MLRIRSLRVLLAGALLALSVAIPAGAAQANVNPDGETFTPATVWDAMPKGPGYACEFAPIPQGSNIIGQIECDHVLWGKRESDLPLLRGGGYSVNHDRWNTDVWNVGVHDMSDYRLLGTFCDMGGAGFDPQCQRERKTGIKVPVNALWNDNPDSLDAGNAMGARFINYVSKDLMARDQWVMSGNGRYGLTFQSDGNLVAYGPKRKVLWSSGTGGHPQSNLRFQADGNIVIYDADNTVLWNSGTWGNPGSTLKVQNDGNVVLYRANGSAAWYTGWDR